MKNNKKSPKVRKDKSHDGTKIVRRKLKKEQKKDYVPMVLYARLMEKYLAARVLEKELVEYLTENYQIFYYQNDKNTNKERAEGFIGDAIYGHEYSVEVFIKEFKKVAKKK